MMRRYQLRENPGSIKEWAYKRGYEPSAALVFSAWLIYFDILVDQLRQPTSPIAGELAQVARCGVHGLKFQQTSGNSEYVWSTGRRSTRDGDDYPGYNLYGLLLTRILLKRQLGEVPFEVCYSISDLLTNPYAPLIQKFQAKKTVLIVSDSYCRQLGRVDGGRVIRLSGATFGTLVFALASDPSVSFQDYHYVIIHAGINDIQKSRPLLKPWLTMFKYIESCISHGFPTNRILISLPIPQPSVGVQATIDYSNDVLRSIAGTGIKSVSWGQSNPFVQDGQWNRRLSDPDQFHLQHAGFRVLWEKWTDELLHLNQVGYQLDAWASQQDFLLARVSDPN